MIGIAGGLVGTNQVLEAQASQLDSEPPTALDLPPSVETDTAYAQTTHEVAPPESVASEEVAAEPVVDEPAVAPPSPTAKKSEAARSPRIRIKKPARPRPVVREAPPPQPPSEPEDLYDTR